MATSPKGNWTLFMSGEKLGLEIGQPDKRGNFGASLTMDGRDVRVFGHWYGNGELWFKSYPNLPSNPTPDLGFFGVLHANTTPRLMSGTFSSVIDQTIQLHKGLMREPAKPWVAID